MILSVSFVNLTFETGWGVNTLTPMYPITTPPSDLQTIRMILLTPMMISCLMFIAYDRHCAVYTEDYKK